LSTPLPRGPGRKLGLSDINDTGSGLPSRLAIYGTEGIGKTSFAVSAPRTITLMTRGETGLLTLIDSGRIPPAPHFPESLTWSEMLDAIAVLTDQPHEYRTLVIDTINGAERLCHEHVCRRDYGGRWGRDGFTSFMQGYEVSLSDWQEFLSRLDRLRTTRRMGIIVLAHSRIATFKNPEGADYDRFVPDLHAKTWAATHKWADAVLFLNFETYVDSDRTELRGKGKGGSRRKLYTQRTAAYDAKNRHGLPAEIDGGRSAAEAWLNLATAMKAARSATPSTTDTATVADVQTIDMIPGTE
jgi:AAA domain